MYRRPPSLRKKSGGNTQLLPRAKMLLFPMSFFCSGGFSLNEKMWFLPLIFHTERSWHAYWFSAIIVSGRVICPLMQEHSLQLKKLIRQAPEDAMLKIRRPVYKQLFKSNHVLRADQKSDVNQTCQQSVFSPMGACIRIWCTAAGAVEQRSQMFSLRGRLQMFVYRLSPFRFSLLAFFHPFPKQRACSQASSVSFGLPPSFLEASQLASNACSRSVTQKKNNRLFAM